jgi:T-complex protein 1 subunit eta
MASIPSSCPPYNPCAPCSSLDHLKLQHQGNATISNDGATLLKLLDIVHPAAKTLVDIARAQDAEVGDGTTSVVLLAGEILKEIRPFVEDGVGVWVIEKGLRTGANLVSLPFGIREQGPRWG